MILYEKAHEILQNAVHVLGTERIPFTEALHRILAEDITTGMAIPSFDKSAMDGYACRKSNLQNVLEVIETIPAGQIPQFKIGGNQCAKIMTGAMIPEGADMVIMIEQVKKLDETHIQFTLEKSTPNICYLGEDVQKDEIVLTKGSSIQASHISVLATVGAVLPLVYKQPKIAILVTGSELIEPQEEPKVSQIRNSNGYTIAAQLQKAHLTANYFGIVPDDKEKTRDSIKVALKKHDVLLLSGAVSVGDFDYIPEILKEEGFEIGFHGILTKPGKRLLFGQKNQQWVFGLPGNPVSTFVQMFSFVMPFLHLLMGNTSTSLTYKLPIAKNFNRKKADKMEFLPCRLNTQNEIEFILYNGSGHLISLVKAQGFIVIPLGISQIAKGEKATFIPI